ncbi:flagellar transcriptional regulator FlhD [Limnobacter humi]|uniref:Flagellar transcriptional regulator FlhD n=1 Tax=Limnobacter humi TaxID=1778671 RepID=A0ABT1WEF0_9BURK|nr:flagellar transcriptional regulator FlhD [Limnobacter humi]MCQ8895879.1 flagellar transcriptional regulator FlhD [Limnobacter humi]
MRANEILEQIREANLSYLLLAKQMINDDKAEAVIRLGIDEQTAELLSDLTTAQVLKMAASDLPMCSLRFTDPQVWKLASDHGKDRNISGMHAAILMAGRSVNIQA